MSPNKLNIQMIMPLTDSSKDEKTDRLLLVLKLTSGKRWLKRIKCVPRLLGRPQYLLPNYRQISTVQNISNFALSLPLASYLLLAYLESSTSVTLAFQNWEKQHKLGVKTMSALKVHTAQQDIASIGQDFILLCK